MRIVWFPIVFGLLILTSCKQPDEKPELKDPIYQELQAKPAAFETKIKDQEKKIAEKKKKLGELPSGDPSRKRAVAEIESMERALVFLRQDAQYYSIRAEQRRVFARKEYMKAFNDGKDWPDPAEYDEYQKMKKLRESSRHWEDHVPKLTRYLPPKPESDAKKAETKPAGGGEGGGEAPAAGGHE